MKARVATIAFLAAASISTWPSDADAAGDANGLGHKHQLIITADRLVPLVSYTRESVDSNELPQNTPRTDSLSGSSISLLWGNNFFDGQRIHSLPRVALDFTVIERLTVGGAIAFAVGLGGSQSTERERNGRTETTESDAPKSTVFGFVPRVGYILPLTEMLAVWPRGGMGIYTTRRKVYDDDNNDVSVTTGDTIFSLDLDPQLAIVPFEHFYFSVGPLVNIPLTASRKIETQRPNQTNTTSNDLHLFQFGITASLGGFFNL
jgi:hypothetical protein